MGSSERRQLLGSGSDHTSGHTFSHVSDTKSSGEAGDFWRSFMARGSTEGRFSTSSRHSLRLLKTETPPLPTVWKSHPTSSTSSDPDKNKVKKHTSPAFRTELTQVQFFMHLLRASVGTGILSSPSAVANAGLPIAMTGILLTSLIILHSINLLVECTHFLRNRFGLHDVYLDYGNTVEYAFAYGKESARKYKWLSKLLNFSLGVVQFGVAVIYIIFVSENTRLMVEHYQPSFNQPLVIYMLLTSIVLLPVCFMKSLKFVSILSGIGNILFVVSITFILAYCVQDLPPMDTYPLITSIEKIPLFFGVVVFSFESINAILPLENALRDKRNLLGIFGLLNSTFYFVLIMYLAVAFYGYVKFGENVGGSLTYSLPFTPWYAMVAKPMYTVLIALSFGLQYYILIEISWHALISVTPTWFHKDWINNLLRLVMYLALFGIALGVPYIEHVISFTGALAGSCICFIFPPMIHIILFWEHRNKFYSFKLTVAKNIFIILFGVFGGCIGSYTSILAICDAIKKDHGL